MASQRTNMNSNIFSSDSFKITAEKIGISNVPDDCALFIGETIRKHIKTIIKDAANLSVKENAVSLNVSHINKALEMRKEMPTFGHWAEEAMSFRSTSCGGKDLFVIEDRELDLENSSVGKAPKLKQDIKLHCHWLMVNGEQFGVPENPVMISDTVNLDESKDESFDQNLNLQKSELVLVKSLATHELSVEQQFYYKNLTEACVGSDEGSRLEALQSLASDPGIYALLPRICVFISEGIRLNIVYRNLALLIYLMRMVKSLADNPTICFERYLHEILPAVMSCVISKSLSSRPDDNHFALRDYASRQLGLIAKIHSNDVNKIQARLIKVFTDTIKSSKRTLSSIYGAVYAMGELGEEIVEKHLIPLFNNLAKRVLTTLAKVPDPGDRMAIQNLRKTVVRIMPHIVLLSDDLLTYDYCGKFGCFSPLVYNEVNKLYYRSQGEFLPANPAATASNLLTKSAAVNYPYAPNRSLGFPVITADTPIIFNSGLGSFANFQTYSVDSMKGGTTSVIGGISVAGGGRGRVANNYNIYNVSNKGGRGTKRPAIANNNLKMLKEEDNFYIADGNSNSTLQVFERNGAIFQGSSGGNFGQQNEDYFTVNGEENDSEMDFRSGFSTEYLFGNDAREHNTRYYPGDDLIGEMGKVGTIEIRGVNEMKGTTTTMATMTTMTMMTATTMATTMATTTTTKNYKKMKKEKVSPPKMISPTKYRLIAAKVEGCASVKVDDISMKIQPIIRGVPYTGSLQGKSITIGGNQFVVKNHLVPIPRLKIPATIPKVKAVRKKQQRNKNYGKSVSVDHQYASNAKCVTYTVKTLKPRTTK